jgi:NADP-dependent 3-hydroxy acid dehydrogenase YdfG
VALQAEQVFNVNVFGIIQMLQAVIPHMRKERSGKIINIGSVSGKFSQAINGGYCASKHAVEAISDALRLHSFHIQSTVINAITPSR